MCYCENIEVGSYDNQVEFTLPPHMAKYKRKQGGAKTICVDLCIANEINHLWSMGITTTGCCCGHNKVDPYIGVIEDDINRMVGLGYKTRLHPIDPTRKDSFTPKSIKATNHD